MKHEGPNFDKSWRAASLYRPVSIAECDPFIKAHYLHRRPAVVQLCLLAEVTTLRPTPMGCVVYSAAPKETTKRYGGLTWELARLYFLEWVPRNAETWLISGSVKYIKQNFPTVEYLVSYADPRCYDPVQNKYTDHTGAIYKAANWTIDRDTDDGRKSPRNDLFDPATGKIYSRWSAAPSGVKGCIKVPRSRKHRFFLKLK